MAPSSRRSRKRASTRRCQSMASAGPTSYGLIGSIVSAMSMCGAVRHGTECFNFYVRRRGGANRPLPLLLPLLLPSLPPPPSGPRRPNPPLAPSHDPRRPCAPLTQLPPPPHPSLAPIPTPTVPESWIDTVGVGRAGQPHGRRSRSRAARFSPLQARPRGIPSPQPRLAGARPRMARVLHELMRQEEAAVASELVPARVGRAGSDESLRGVPRRLSS